ncbi:protein SAAL1-like isoform X2 [Dysidea avara]|uniref:protein SAAL1-like isoform X2 n=1 Tax=Dysidea avara TaxID=196820 RepID=UPI0033255A94
MAYRNPSPPPDASPLPEEGTHDEEMVDQVGDTVFSKSWLLSVMAKTVADTRYKRQAGGDGSIKVVEEVNKNKTNEDEDPVTELDDDMEDELCKLWDASMNEDVAFFLHGHHAPLLLLHVNLESTSPRLSEICAGVVANLVCHLSIAKDVTEDDEIVCLICDSLFSSDPATLLETCRLMHTCLSHSTLAQSWTNTLGVREVKDQLLFILHSSTHDELVAKVLQVIERLMDESSELLKVWSNPELISAVYDASSIASSAQEMSPHLSLLQLVSTSSDGVVTLGECSKEVSSLVGQYFSLLAEEDYDVSLQSQAFGLTAALSVLNILLENGLDKSKLSSITEIQHVLKQLHDNSQSNNESSDIGSLLTENVEKLIVKLQ